VSFYGTAVVYTFTTATCIRYIYISHLDEYEISEKKSGRDLTHF
jgi:hypothetical protein